MAVFLKNIISNNKKVETQDDKIKPQDVSPIEFSKTKKYIETKYPKIFNFIKNIKDIKKEEDLEKNALKLSFKSIDRFTSKKFDAKNYSFIREAFKKSISSQRLSNSNDDICVYQPYGKQRFPDMILAEKDLSVVFEHKESKGKNILWNEGIPKDNCFYIFNQYKESAEKNKTIVFSGTSYLDYKETRKQVFGAMKEFNEIISNWKEKWNSLESAVLVNGRIQFSDRFNWDENNSIELSEDEIYLKLNEIIE